MLDGISGSTVMTVTAAVLQSISVTPANPTIAKGTTQQFTATGSYSDSSTQDLTSQVTWASATPSVASITAGGLATGLDTGTSNVSASLAGISGSTVLTVSAAVLQSISVTPANPSVPSGRTQQFTATGTYSDNSTQDLTTQVAWASGTSSVATITSGGLATGVAVGTSTISASSNGISGSTVLTVTAAVLQSIAVAPVDPSVAKGLTVQFTATGTYSDSSTQDLTSQVTWVSSDTTIASITSGGLATAASPGTSTITASLGGISGTSLLTVTDAVLQMLTIDPNGPSVPAGETVQFTATGTYSDNSTQDLTTQVTWDSTPTSVATISNSAGSQGLATGVAMGMATISAALGGVNTTAMLMVTEAELESITVTPANSSITQGSTQQFTAMGTYSDDSTLDLTTQVSWASDTGSVATIDASGLATGVGAGDTTISGTLGGVTGTTVLTVTAVPLATISGTVFEDLDGNGVQDPGESGLQNWVIQLLSGSTVGAIGDDRGRR